MDNNLPNQGYQMVNINQMNPNNQNMQMYNNPEIQMINNPNMMPQGYNQNIIPQGNNGYIGQPIFNQNLAQGRADYKMREIFQMGSNMTAFFEETDYLNSLRLANGAHIKQKVEIMEAFTGCETKNRYNVFLKHSDGTYVYIFKAKEDSSWCSRNCLASDCRPFSMKIKWVKSGVKEPDEWKNPLLTFERPYKLTCYCFNRPEMVGFNHSENKMIGRVYEPFKCCDPNFQIFNELNFLKYLVAGDCCQCGISCKSCGKCYETKFYIFDADNPSRDPSQSLGSITRKNPGISKAMFTDADNFDVIFPNNASPYEKLMIIGATLMIDYAFFEDQGDD